MMVPKKTLLLAGAALALFGATSAAQSGKMFRNAQKRIKSAEIDLATGTVTRGAAVSDRCVGTVSDFSNNDLLGIGVDTGSCFCEWFDAAHKGGPKGVTYNQPGNKSNLLSVIRFAYCSDALDTLSGGPGGTTKLGYYTNYLPGGPVPDAANTCVTFTLTGLPANTACTSFFPFLASSTGCWFISLTFGTPVCCGDGQIGYSWKFMDLDTVGTLAKTFPFLACVQSCTPTGFAGPLPDGQGMFDVLDEYCPPGFLLASAFTFNSNPGTTPQFTSMSMSLREVADCTATVETFTDAAPVENLDTLTATPVILNANWVATINRTGGGGTGGFWSIRVNNARLAGNGLACKTVTTPLASTGRNMLGGASLANSTSLPCLGGGFGAGNAIATTTCAVPKNIALCGLFWAAQGLVRGGTTGINSRWCTSCVDGTVGTK